MCLLSQESQIVVMMSALRSSKHNDDDGSSLFRLTLNGIPSSDINNTSSQEEVRISFELHDPNTKLLTNAFVYPDKKCPLGEVTIGRKGLKTGQYRDGALPPSLIRIDDTIDGRSSGRVLDLTVTITTNLKILFIGDSVMLQLSEVFDESLGGLEMQSRTVLWESWYKKMKVEGGTIVSPTRGGGISALWRMTGLLSTLAKINNQQIDVVVDGVMWKLIHC